MGWQRCYRWSEQLKQSPAAASLAIIDAHVHVWEADSAKYRWESPSRVPPSFEAFFRDDFTPEQLIWMMDAVGVSGAILTSPLIYGSDHSYALDAARRYPDRFRVVAPVFPEAPDLDEQIVAMRDESLTVGVRVVCQPAKGESLADAAYHRICRAAQGCQLPLFLSPNGALSQVGELAESFPDLLLVLDHLGLLAPGTVAERWLMLPDLLDLARYSNVAVKCTAAPSLSEETYPFADLWPRLERVIAAFGPERLMWGTDITLYRRSLTYCEALDYLRRNEAISQSAKSWILGGTAKRLLPWNDQ
jgi:L-fuconolactonase